MCLQQDIRGRVGRTKATAWSLELGVVKIRGLCRVALWEGFVELTHLTRCPSAADC